MQICPVCQRTEPSLRVLDSREPKGFFTDLSPADFEGQFEWTPRSTRPTLGIDTTTPDRQTTAGNTSVIAVTDRIRSINDCDGAGGFDFQAATVRGNQYDGAYAAITNPSGVSGNVGAAGPSWRVALLSQRLTNVLLAGINDWPTGVFAPPTTVEGRAAWYSFAFWLQIAAGVRLDVDPLELQVGFRARSGPNGPIGEAFLSDQLENGAGYCIELADRSNFERLLEQSDPSIPNSIALNWTELTAMATDPTPHAVECDTSCNRCLRDFRNLPYHGLLDWRLALDMARLASSATTTVDLETSWGRIPNPWTNLVQASGPIASALQRLGYRPSAKFGNLRGYVHLNPGRRTVLIERHPLWQDDHPEWMTAVSDAETRYAGYDARPLNPFRVLRRIADYV